MEKQCFELSEAPWGAQGTQGGPREVPEKPQRGPIEAPGRPWETPESMNIYEHMRKWEDHDRRRKAITYNAMDIIENLRNSEDTITC